MSSLHCNGWNRSHLTACYDSPFVSAVPAPPAAGGAARALPPPPPPKRSGGSVSGPAPTAGVVGAPVPGIPQSRSRTRLQSIVLSSDMVCECCASLAFGLAFVWLRVLSLLSSFAAPFGAPRGSEDHEAAGFETIGALSQGDHRLPSEYRCSVPCHRHFVFCHLQATVRAFVDNIELWVQIAVPFRYLAMLC